MTLKLAFLAFFGFSTGLVISGAVFAFISVVGVIQRLAQKTQTTGYIMLYEEAIAIGGIIGLTAIIYNYYIPVGLFLGAIFSACIGVFYGLLALSLAEILNAIPILTRRARIQKGMFYFVMALALGKLAGSILYFTVSGFFKPS